MAEFRPTNPETDDVDNREPGIVPVPGSNFAKERRKWEQFPSVWGSPGNPYVKREFPKMLYRAELWNGKAFCMAPDPDRLEFSSANEYKRKLELARKFNERCQMIVNDEQEMQRAMENGWRTHPSEAVAYLESRETEKANITAQRNYEDRNMSEMAKREIAAASEAVGGEHQPEIPRQPVRRRGRTKGSKNKPRG